MKDFIISNYVLILSILLISIITLIGCTGFRIIFILFLFPIPYFHTIFWLFAVYPISWIIIDLCYIPIILFLQKKAFKQIEN